MKSQEKWPWMLIHFCIAFIKRWRKQFGETILIFFDNLSDRTGGAVALKTAIATAASLWFLKEYNATLWKFWQA